MVSGKENWREKLTSLPIDLEADDNSIENGKDKDDSPGDDGSGIAIFYLPRDIWCWREGIKVGKKTYLMYL